MKLLLLSQPPAPPYLPQAFSPYSIAFMAVSVKVKRKPEAFDKRKTEDFQPTSTILTTAETPFLSLN